MTVHSQWCIIVDHAGKEQTVKKNKNGYGSISVFAIQRKIKWNKRHQKGKSSPSAPSASLLI